MGMSIEEMEGSLATATTPTAKPGSMSVDAMEASLEDDEQTTGEAAGSYMRGGVDLLVDILAGGEYLLDTPQRLMRERDVQREVLRSKGFEGEPVDVTPAPHTTVDDVWRQRMHNAAGGALGYDPAAPEPGSDAAAREMAAKGLALTGPFLPFVGPVAGSVAAGGALAGPFIENEVAEQTGSEGAGLAANLAVTALAPMTIETAAPRVLNARNMKLAQKAAKTKMTPAIRKLKNAINERLATRYEGNFRELTDADMFYLSGELKYLFPKSRVKGGVNFFDEAIDDLTKAIDDPLFARARPMQAMNQRLTRQRLAEYEEGLAEIRGMGDEFIQLTEGQNEEFMRVVSQQFEDFLPEGSPEGALEFHRSLVSSMQDDAANLWEKVPEGRFRNALPTDDFLAKIEAIYDDAEGVTENVPKILANFWNEAPETFTMRRLQNTRSNLLAIERAGQSELAKAINPTLGQQARYAKMARIELDAVIDKLPKGRGKAYAKARTATRKWKQITDPDRPGGEVAKLMMKEAGAEEGLGKMVLRSKGHAKRAMETLGRTPESRANIERTVMNEVFGSDFIDQVGVDHTRVIAGTKTPKQIRKFIDTKARALKEVLGEERVQGMLDIADRIEAAQAGRLGTRAALLSTGSNKRKALAAGTRALRHPIAATDAAIESVLKSLETDVSQIAAMQEIFLDPELMRTLLQMPTNANKAQYVLEWKKVAARALARSSAVAYTDDIDEALAAGR